MNFGTVNLGGVANQTLTVQNTVGGPYPGRRSVTAPFSIVSESLHNGGAEHDPDGDGTLQPDDDRDGDRDVTFASNGDTVSRIVSGSRSRCRRPTVTITTPTTNPTFSTSTPTLTLGVPRRMRSV